MGACASAGRAPSADVASGVGSTIVELRQYTLKPERRDELIELFDREFVEPQEALGIHLIGQFRDLDRLDRFVWLRGHGSFADRGPTLEAFYSGPVWQAHREQANATMLDSDNVLLLQPVGREHSFTALPERSDSANGGVVVITLYPIREEVTEDFAALFRTSLAPLFTSAGATEIEVLITSHAPNEFPRLPVRRDVYAFVRVASFASISDYTSYQRHLDTSMAWRQDIGRALWARLAGNPEELRLQPTERSRLRHSAMASTGAARRTDGL